MDLEKKAQDFLSQREDLTECLVTSDGNVFLPGNEAFAQSHARKIGDMVVKKVKKAEKEEPKAEAKGKKKSAKSKDD